MDKKKEKAPKSFSEKQLKAFVIKLRKRHLDIEKRAIFCSEHNFKFEEKVIRGHAELIQNIIHEIEMEFDLGYVGTIH